VPITVADPGGYDVKSPDDGDEDKADDKDQK
jgi:hypothetical protein